MAGPPTSSRTNSRTNSRTESPPAAPKVRTRRARGVRIAAALLALALLGANDSCEQRGTVYGLTVESGYEHGCFPPALCPAVRAPLGGTFRLTEQPAPPIPGARLFVVHEIFWLVRQGDRDVRVTGWGTYQLIGDFVQQHQMALHLSVGGAPPVVFDSGAVVMGETQFPNIDIRVSLNNERVFDTVFHVNAVPFRRVPGPGTPCGPVLVCDSAREICVAQSPIGPAVIYECRPIPEGCEEDRTCGCAADALCEAPFDACFDRGRNSLECVCLECQ